MSIQTMAEHRERVTNLSGNGLQLRHDECFEHRLDCCCALCLYCRREWQVDKGGNSCFNNEEYFGLHDSFNIWCGAGLLMARQCISLDTMRRFSGLGGKLSLADMYHLKNVSRKYNRTAENLVRCFHVDNMVTNDSTASDACELCDQATEISAKAGMKLRKWATNCTDLENCVEQPDHAEILGLLWNAKSDRLSLNVYPVLEFLQEYEPMK
ncbi:hypothetical protein MRX96_028028 [Rhipicephalus microplus]